MKLFSYWKFHGLGPWNRWTECTTPAHGSTDPSLNDVCRIRDLRPRSNNAKRYFHVLILDVPSRMDDQEQIGTRKRKQTMALGHWTQQPPLLCHVRSPTQGGGALRWVILDEFGSYGIGAMWRARFAYLEVVVVGEGSRQWWPFFLKLGRRCWGGVSSVPQAMGKTPMGAVDSVYPSWAVGSTWSTTQWCGDG
jgi:hypothetical protein